MRSGPRQAIRRAAVLAPATAVLLVAGCTSSASTGPTFAPSPDRSSVEGSGGVAISPIVPIPSGGGSGSGSSGGTGSSGTGSTTPGQQIDPFVVATKLSSPVGLAILPDGTALVGERTTGRIERVQPVAGRPVTTVRTLSGLDVSGDGGLLDLALSPTYAQDSLVYAYITTPTDNRVVTFTLTGPVTPVLTGIPKGKTGNTGRISFGADGVLSIGTGDAGQPALAANATSLAGKTLRVSDIGRPEPDNPNASSPVFTSGHHVVDGLCPTADGTTLFEVEAGSTGGSDEVNVITRGAYYGWPTARAGSQAAAALLPTGYTNPGGCAVQGNRLYVTSLDGSALISATFTATGGQPKIGTFSVALKGKYGRLRTVVPAPDGALWLTTSNKDGQGKPVPADERVIRYVPTGGGGDNNPL